MRIELGNCVVRPWRRTDRASLVRHANSRNVWRNLMDWFPHPYTDAAADDWFDRVERQAQPGDFAIEVQGQAVGGIGFNPGSGMFARTAEFGYWLGEAWWGRGIATEAARAVASYVFERFPLQRLEAAVFEGNPASMRVLEKAAFTREGVLRRSIVKDGRLIDRVLYARLRDS